MKFLFFLISAMIAANALAQKVDFVTYNQLTNTEQAKFLSKKIDFKAIQMPDGTMLKIGDTVQLGERYGSKQITSNKVKEDVYSTVFYGGGFSNFLEGWEENGENYNVFKVDKGSQAVLSKFKARKKMDGTFVVFMVLESVSKQDFNGEKKARASLESFEKGELIKIK
jgi:hypothetical protein